MNKIFVAVALLLVTVAPASAGLIDFEGLPQGNNPNPLALPGATFTTLGGFNYVFFTAATNWLCSSASSSNASDCSPSLDVAFDAPASNLSFAFGGNNILTVGASVGEVQIFSGATLLGTVNMLVSDGQSFTKDLVQLTGFSSVTRLLVSSTDHGGLAYDDFAFDTAAVPDPGSSLLLLGMSLVGLKAWRKRLA